MAELSIQRVLFAPEDAQFAVGIAADGTVSAATPEGTLVVHFGAGPGRTPDIVMCMQQGLAAQPRELGRYRLRAVLAAVLRAARSRGQPLRKLPRAQRLALAHFVCINFEVMMLIAHAWPSKLPLLLIAGA